MLSIDITWFEEEITYIYYENIYNNKKENIYIVVRVGHSIFKISNKLSWQSFIIQKTVNVWFLNLVKVLK